MPPRPACPDPDRRAFLAASLGWAAAATVTGVAACQSPGGRTGREPLYRISLAQWSFHRALQARAMDPLDFPGAARALDIGAVEYVNQFYKEQAGAPGFPEELKRRADGEGVRSLLIMCDGEGRLGDPDEGRRAAAVENHRKWLEAAAALGCHSIRVNAASAGSWEEQQRLAADGLRRLCELAEGFDLSVLVENHGGLSSNGSWLAGVMRAVDHARCGTLPDFGNFRVSRNEEYDRYQGVAELMPWARAVSAKSYDFDGDGEETTIDYRRMLGIVTAAGYRGFVGIEYEGERLPEREGILATKGLLERVRAGLS